MSRQVGSLHRSIFQPANLQKNLPIIPLFALPRPQSPHHNTSSSIESDSNYNTTVHNTISQFYNSDIETPDEFDNSESSPITFSQPPFQLIHSKVKIEPSSPQSPISYVTPTYSPLTNEPSDNNDQDNTQISHELDNFITLQQQVQHHQTLTIHQLPRSITSSFNPSTPTPSSNYTPSQNPTSSSTPSSSTNRAYRTFKRKFQNTPFPSNRGTSTTFVNHPLHTNTKQFLQIRLLFSLNIRTSIQTPMMKNPIMLRNKFYTLHLHGHPITTLLTHYHYHILTPLMKMKYVAPNSIS